MRVDKLGGQSLHYFHYCAIQNRIEFEKFPDILPHICLNSPKKRALLLLRSVEDDNNLAHNFCTLISRILFDNMNFFKHTSDGIISWHIQHKYSTEMSEKSLVVSK